jgi:cysteine-rich repeat protein
MCQCKPNYIASGPFCVDFCGDGINTAGNSTIYCDDGNFFNGDGCGYNCAVESGYGCFVPPGERRSHCSGVKSITLKYLWT